MKRNFALLLLCCALLMMLLSVINVMAQGQEDGIIGTVTVASKDANGKVTAVKIVADEGEYLVADNDKGKELLALVDKDVDVSGTVKDSGGKKTLTVTSFEVIEE
ncbi:MAG TPA: hypothetical protein DCE18_20925 [Syntrophobacteraceae bacterium]|jgi:hypothetical protein|nr:hypothetical protein [Syntrophobacteraceae bacterium]